MKTRQEIWGDFTPPGLTETDQSPEGGACPPPDGGYPERPRPLPGGGMAQGGEVSACIVNYGQKLETSKPAENLALRMVGSGDECEPDGWAITASCPKCGYKVNLVKHGCGVITCPACSKKWARRAAERSAARVWGAMQAGFSKWKPRHITFDLDVLSWEAAKKYAASIGATGGVLVLHPWRLKDEYEQMFEMMAEKTGMNRYDIAKESAIGMDAFEWSPHCHGVLYGKFVDVEKGSDKFKYRNIRRMNSQHGTEGTLVYLFGHTFIPPTANGKCYRYFGFCSPQKLKPTWTGSRSEPMTCPHCQALLVQEGTNEIILCRHLATEGWHKVIKIPGVKVGGSRTMKKLSRQQQQQAQDFWPRPVACS